MDEQKKRLIELLDGFEDDIALCDVCERSGDDCLACMNDRYADYLLANGVLVPPCKVGDTVWILRLKDEITEGNVYAIERNRDSRYPLWLGIEYEDKIEGICYYNVRADMIGKNVFLTREEAEAALAERTGGKI